jgi:hypothetical protein
MSLFSENVREKIYQTLSGDSELKAFVTDICHLAAQPKAKLPLIIFNRIPGAIGYAAANNLVFERDLWLIKAVVSDDDSKTESPDSLAEKILILVDALLNGTSFSMTNSEILLIRRKSEMPPYKENLTDGDIRHFGAYYEVTSG